MNTNIRKNRMSYIFMNDLSRFHFSILQHVMRDMRMFSVHEGMNILFFMHTLCRHLHSANMSKCGVDNSK